jgi:hypothetical protein
VTEKSIAAARRLVSQDNVNRASLLLLVIAIGWSIYAAFSLLWNDYLSDRHALMSSRSLPALPCGTGFSKPANNGVMLSAFISSPASMSSAYSSSHY